MGQPDEDLSEWRTPDGIVRFVKEVLRVEDLAPYQEQILRALVTRKRVAVRGPHGLGKTALAAWVILWVMAVYPDDVKVPTPGWRARSGATS